MSSNPLIAQALLSTAAVKLNVRTPFTFVSGIKSPIYCDNRRLIGFPTERALIVKSFVAQIRANHPEVEVIAGTATAGIPWAAFIAAEMNLPMAYIRGEKKAHGAGRQIEGAEVTDKKVLVIEDLISTGKSVIKAVEAARNEGASAASVLAIFSYQFASAEENFANAEIEFQALTHFDTLLQQAEAMNYISDAERQIAATWNKNPQAFGVSN